MLVRMEASHLIAAAGETFGIGVIVSAFLFGFRHGIDWDHIAAITDITGSQDDRRSAIVLRHAVRAWACRSSSS